MKTFKFLPGFLPVKAIGGYKGKINYLIIEYREEQVLVNEFETGLTRVDFVHISGRDWFIAFTLFEGKIGGVGMVVANQITYWGVG